MMSGVAWVMAALGLSIWFRRLYDDWCNPATIHTAVWLGFLGVSYFGPIIVRATWTGENVTKEDIGHLGVSALALGVIVGTYVLFIAGVMLGAGRGLARDRPRDFAAEMCERYDVDLCWRVGVALFILSFAVFLYSLHYHGWRAPLFDNSLLSVDLPVLGYVTLLSRVVLVLAVLVGCLRYRLGNRVPWRLVAVGLVCFAMLWADGSRCQVFTPVVLASVVAYYVMDRRPGQAVVASIGAVLLIAFFGVLTSRSMRDGLGWDTLQDHTLLLFLDTGAGFGNFSYVLENHEPFYLPVNTITMFDTFSGRALIAVASDRCAMVFGSGVLATYVTHIYYDYGYWGVFTLPLVLGLGTGWVYSFAMRKPGIFSLFTYAILSVSTLITFRTFRYTAHTTTVYYPVAAYFVDWLCRRGPKSRRGIAILAVLAASALIGYAVSRLCWNEIPYERPSHRTNLGSVR